MAIYQCTTITVYWNYIELPYVVSLLPGYPSLRPWFFWDRSDPPGSIRDPIDIAVIMLQVTWKLTLDSTAFILTSRS